MHFTFTEEHEELRRTVRRFLEQRSDEQAVRRAMETERGYDDDVWSQMAGQMGLQGLIVPAEHGGAGLGWVEMMVVLEEMGRSLLCAPYLSTAVLAAGALVEAGSEEARSEILPGIASGETIATLAFVDDGRGWDVADVQMQATKDGDGWKLSGVKNFVLDGHTADVILVVARGPDGLSLFRVDAGAAGLERALLPTLDLTRKLARVSFSSTPAKRVGASGDLTSQLRRVLDLAVVGLVAEQVGGAQRCLEMSTEYARTRLQFGRPIGSFQAIKHRCADMLVSVEFAKSAAYNAGFTAAEGDGDLASAAHIAKSYCSEAYFHAAADNIQIHGGMGFTWEHPAHLYFKRAKSSSVLFGDPMQHREQLAQSLGI
ncbi:MAG: acyl-CoA dehydrogenase [Deltaproteobacteria bacterium]|nr:acyl-CoA dehydrogenase [Deltaproteobacteria bacterium]